MEMEPMPSIAFRAGFEKTARKKRQKIDIPRQAYSLAKEVGRMPRSRAGLARLLIRLSAKQAITREANKGMKKHGASRFAKVLAKQFGGTPKQVSTKIYKELAQKTGKIGRNVFRMTKGLSKGSRTSKLGQGAKGVHRISIGDPLNLRPQNAKPLSIKGESYVGDTLQHKQKYRPLNPNVDKGTIAKRPEVRKSRIRMNQMIRNGVGDLKFGSSKEWREKVRLKQKEYDRIRTLKK